ncbi:IS256 family transposase [Verminephrobacter aporrectodeae]|uniref:IS256 family transposase n=1 Tax=Verminephrobacter aporrectodeae TaxID=1110389 RepID=UPI002237453D|nr:IS256 family transposase [Verminephrobacter aporrectodeae]MCW5222956.1 IS256 family transposase [Verminephrobacter aporrectodeae subsp. tuberculatae]
MKDRKSKSNLKVVHRNDRAQVKRVLADSGQALLPMLELIEGARASIEELMHEAAVGLVEQLLVLSAQDLAGAKQRGREAGPVLWHGAQRGVIGLAERQLRVQRPRLRDKNGREVRVPAYERLRNHADAATRVRDILIAGVCTRRYAQVLPEAAGTVGVSKSAVSGHFVEASAAQLAQFNERSLIDLKVLVIYIDGIIVNGHHIIAALGVDDAGDKHLLGLSLGASENAQVVKDLLRRLIERGLDATLSYLFVIDGSKALRSAIDEMFGKQARVQRCRTHKLRNVLERLPKTEAAQTKAVMTAAYKLGAKEGMAKLQKQAQWLQREHAGAAALLLEGLEETFTVNALGLPPSLTRCLCTTNIIENPNGIVRRTSRRVTRYRDADMALRWTAAGFIEAQKSFRKIQGVRDLWILETALGRRNSDSDLAEPREAA